MSPLFIGAEMASRPKAVISRREAAIAYVTTGQGPSRSGGAADGRAHHAGLRKNIIDEHEGLSRRAAASFHTDRQSPAAHLRSARKKSFPLEEAQRGLLCQRARFADTPTPLIRRLFIDIISLASPPARTHICAWPSMRDAATH